MSQRNKDLPAMPVHPMQDKFGQVILMAGMTKLEMTALNLFTAYLSRNDNNLSDEDMEAYIYLSYDYAEQFCSYLETKDEEKSGSIII